LSPRCFLPRSGGPFIFVANHQSHLDTVAVLAGLPPRLRARTTVAAAADFLFGRMSPASLFTSLVLNMFPFFRKDKFRANLVHIGGFIDKGRSVVIFPEGTRSRTGAMGEFKNGVGVIVKEMRVSVVPVKIRRSFELLPHNRRWPSPGAVETVFGRETRFDTQTPDEITKTLQKMVAELE